MATTAFIVHDESGRATSLSPRQRKAAIAATNADRFWFAANPTRSHRLRPAQADELPAISAEGAGTLWVVVRQITPTMRQRCPFEPPAELPPPPDDEAFGHAVFDLLQENSVAGRYFVPLAALQDRWRVLAATGLA